MRDVRLIMGEPVTSEETYKTDRRRRAQYLKRKSDYAKTDHAQWIRDNLERIRHHHWKGSKYAPAIAVYFRAYGRKAGTNKIRAHITFIGVWDNAEACRAHWEPLLDG